MYLPDVQGQANPHSLLLDPFGVSEPQSEAILGLGASSS